MEKREMIKEESIGTELHSKLFVCAECGEKFTIDEFTAYQVCKVCYDRYWEEYCRYLDEQAEIAQRALDEELQIEGY